MLKIFLIKGIEGPEEATRGGGGELEPSKISRGNSAYVPELTQHAFLLTRSRPFSYRLAIRLRNWVRDRKHSGNTTRCK
jgi:hypothetical protein